MQNFNTQRNTNIGSKPVFTQQVNVNGLNTDNVEVQPVISRPIVKPQLSKSYENDSSYDIERFEQEVFGVDIKELMHLLDYKGNIILQGAPGVGKTYSAKRLAYTMMGVIDDSRISIVQFHQNYGYDDFIVGLRPTESGGFEFVEGPFYTICKKAIADPSNKYFMIIDEINRGNLSKILGEMFSLIEKDHRGESITLKYRNEKFCVPKNLYIIGTMNTADRGLVMLDYALRRRFSFYTMLPAFRSPGFMSKMNAYHNQSFNKLIRRIVELNEVISKDDLLGPGFMIGHSYFCVKNITNRTLEDIVKYEIIPLIDEYWYDDADHKNVEWAFKLQEAIK